MENLVTLLRGFEDLRITFTKRNKGSYVTRYYKNLFDLQLKNDVDVVHTENYNIIVKGNTVYIDMKGGSNGGVHR